MAIKIVQAKDSKEDVTLLVANKVYKLGEGEEYITTDAILLQAVEENPYLDTEEVATEEVPNVPSDYDENDPQDNPSIDHLSSSATQEVKDEAQAADIAIQEENFPSRVKATDEEPVTSDVEVGNVQSPAIAGTDSGIIDFNEFSNGDK